MKTKLLGLTLLAAASMFGAWNIGISIGAPPPPRVIRVQPRSPGPGYTFVQGYWYPVNGRYVWHAGYWSRPPYQGGIWVAPRYEGRQYYEGYWKAEGHEPMGHEHGWDKDKKNRDYRDNH